MSEAIRNLLQEKPLTSLLSVILLCMFGGFGGSYSGGFFGKTAAMEEDLGHLKLQYIQHIEWDIGRKNLFELKLDTMEENYVEKVDALRERIKQLEAKQNEYLQKNQGMRP